MPGAEVLSGRRGAQLNTRRCLKGIGGFYYLAGTALILKRRSSAARTSVGSRKTRRPILWMGKYLRAIHSLKVRTAGPVCSQSGKRARRQASMDRSCERLSITAAPCRVPHIAAPTDKRWGCEVFVILPRFPPFRPPASAPLPCPLSPPPAQRGDAWGRGRCARTPLPHPGCAC